MPDGGAASGPLLLGAGILGSGLANALSGQETQATQGNTIPPELARLYDLQGRQFAKMAPLQSALGEAQARQIGFDVRYPTKRVRTFPTTTPGTPMAPQAFGGGPPLTPEEMQETRRQLFAEYPEAQRLLLLGESGTAIPPDYEYVPAIRGYLPKALRAGDKVGGGEWRDVEDTEGNPTYTYTGTSPLIEALQASMFQRPEESAYASRVGEVTTPLADMLSGRSERFSGFSDDLTRRALAMGDDASRFANRPLGPESDLLWALATQGFAFDPESVLAPLRREYNQTVTPNIRTAALQYGAPRGSGEQELQMRAGERYGTSVAEALSREYQRADLQRRAISTQAAQALQQAELNRRWQGLQGFDTALRGQTLAGQTQATSLEAMMRNVPLMQALRLAGPQALAQYAAQGRELAGRRASVPLDLLRGNTIQIPGIPDYPTSSYRTTTENPTTLARIGEGLGGLGNSALLYALMGQFGKGTPSPLGKPSAFGSWDFGEIFA